MQSDEPDGFEEDADESGEPFVDTCDECGRALRLGLYEGDDPLLTVLPDSSAIYRDNPRNDGKRMVMVCSAECLRKIKERLGRRPFDDREVWAGKIVRALMVHQWKLRPDELEQETHLEPRQIAAGIAWLKEHLHQPPPGSTDRL
ncbi:hypothetical protein AB0D66_26975 [Streptomyces sp. NPDC048270]|uniref:hypothetical protein n=1 Tax=Streptomyces sp. NPDC048270 TaxID=3154615 RepID=UPI0033D32FD6